MRRSHEVLRVGLAAAAMGTISQPYISGLFVSSLLLSFLLPNEVKRREDVDSVTGLLSLGGFRTQLDELLVKDVSEYESDKRIYIATLDILDFGSLGRVYGYAGSRQLLAHVGRVIKQQSQSELSSRPYSDTFLLAYYTPSIDDAIKDLHSVVERIESVGREIDRPISICAGISELSTSMESDGEVDVITSAISRSQIAKIIGKRDSLKINIYKTEYSSKRLERIKMEDCLSKSIINNEISVFYQPKLSSKERVIVGFEALCRWHHREMGFISPSFFIPVAEDTGFIHCLGEFVITEACKTIHEINKHGGKSFSIAVNVSISQLEYLDGKPLMHHIRNSIKDYGILRSQLEVEITESMASKDFELVKSHVRELTSLGVVVSLDDFGTGESTLYRLKELPLNQLKIDKAFVDDLDTVRGRKVMEGIFSIAEAMGLTTVAEGVESEDQAAILQAMGCSYLQGFHFGKPIPKHLLPSVLKR